MGYAMERASQRGWPVIVNFAAIVVLFMTAVGADSQRARYGSIAFMILGITYLFAPYLRRKASRPS